MTATSQAALSDCTTTSSSRTSRECVARPALSLIVAPRESRHYTA